MITPRHSQYRWLAVALVAALAPSAAPSPAYALRAGLEGHESQVGEALQASDDARTVSLPAAGMEEDFEAFGALTGEWQELSDAPEGTVRYRVVVPGRAHPLYVQCQYGTLDMVGTEQSWFAMLQSDPSALQEKHYVTTSDGRLARSLQQGETVTKVLDIDGGVGLLMQAKTLLTKDEILGMYAADLSVMFNESFEGDIPAMPRRRRVVQEGVGRMIQQELGVAPNTITVAIKALLEHPREEQVSRMLLSKPGRL